jgi:UDP-N-acetylmuramate dehydrogenase
MKIILVTAKAGENWHEFVQFTISKNYGGLENLSLLEMWELVIQNIGAYGTEIKDHFISCKALNLETSEVETIDLEQCKFGYRDSILKLLPKEKKRRLRREVKFQALINHQKSSIKTEYGAISTELKNLGIENPTIQDVSKAVINIRQSKLPNPAEIGNAGSFFKNPTYSFRTI